MMSEDDEKGEEITISMDEFRRMHSELMEFKCGRYELESQTKKLNQEIDALKNKNATQYEVNQLEKEINSLKKEHLLSMEQHQVTQNQLTELQQINNVQKEQYSKTLLSFSDDNENLKKELERLKEKFLSTDNNDFNDAQMLGAASSWEVDGNHSLLPIPSDLSLGGESDEDFVNETFLTLKHASFDSITSIDSLRGIAIALNAQLQEFKRKLSLQKENSAEIVNKLELKIKEKETAVSKTVAKMGKENSVLNEQVQQLKDKLSDVTSRVNEKEQTRLLGEEIIRLNDSLQESENVNDNLQKELEEANGLLLAEQDILFSWEQKFEKILSERDDLQDKLTRLQEKTETNEKLMAGLESQNKFLEVDLKLAHKQLTDTQNKNINDTQSLITLEREVTVLREKAKVLNLRETELENFKILEKEWEKDQDEMQFLQQHYNVISNSLKDKAEVAEEMERKLENLSALYEKEKNSRIENENSSQKLLAENQERFEQLSKKYDEDKVEMTKVREEYGALTEKYNDMELKLKFQERKSESTIKDLKKELIRLNGGGKSPDTKSTSSRDRAYSNNAQVLAPQNVNIPSPQNKTKGFRNSYSGPGYEDVREAQEIAAEQKKQLLRELKRLKKQNKFYEDQTKQLTNDNQIKTQIIQDSSLRYFCQMQDKPSKSKTLNAIADEPNFYDMLSWMKGSEGDGNLQNVNQKLQSVLEDVLLKNIKLQENLDSLTAERKNASE